MQRLSPGFTLIEILVVITMIGILISVVSLSFTGASQEQELRGAAEQAARRMELVRANALQRNREWGMYVDDQAYTFAEYDPRTGEWVASNIRPVGPQSLPEGARLELDVEGFDFGGAPESVFALSNSEERSGRSEDENNKVPDVLMFSSGEMTPFELTLIPEQESQRWRVHSDGLSSVRAERGAE